jgi:hypothetical protein
MSRALAFASSGSWIARDTTMFPCYEAQMNHGPETLDREFSEPLVHGDLILYLFASIIYEQTADSWTVS